MKHLFNNKSALITGASSGLGRSLSISLSAHCKKLFLTGRDYKNLKKTASQCAKSCEVEIIAADLTSSEGLYSLILAVNSNVDIFIDISNGSKSFTAYTMDLTKEYIEINADYRS